MKKVAVGNLGAEELAQFQSIVKNRTVNKEEVNALFAQAPKAHATSVKTMDKLLVQAPAAQLGTAPMMAKVAAPAVEAFFEKLAQFDGLTEAQRRFPELQKVAAPGMLARAADSVGRFAMKHPKTVVYGGGAAAGAAAGAVGGAVGAQKGHRMAGAAKGAIGGGALGAGATAAIPHVSNAIFKSSLK